MTAKELKEFELTEYRIDQLFKCEKLAIYIPKRRNYDSANETSRRKGKV